MPKIESGEQTAEDKHALPLVVAVTGHRDLVFDEVAGIEARVRNLFVDLIEKYPDLRLSVMSPLAEGADLLVAEVAVDLGIDLVVPIPMPKDLYLQDFTTADSCSRFEALCRRATDVFELPTATGSSGEKIRNLEADRDRQYAQLGVFLSAHCHILLAIWDGKPAAHLGGTAQVVSFHHDDLMPGYTPTTVAPQQMLVDDESDLVYHVVCSRDRDNGEPLQGLSPLQCSWFTNNASNPRFAEMPEHHKMVFRRASEFSSDASRFANRIAVERYSLLDDARNAELPIGMESIDKQFCSADWLAIMYQKKTIVTLRITYALAFLMGFMFILYSDFETLQIFLLAFFALFVVVTGTQYVAKRRGWHRKYLDYRALAEGLRVQFYWAAAGVVNKNVSKFTHDIYLQTKDPEMGWIRNVMRVAGTRCDATSTRDSAGLEFALEQWVGNVDGGQLAYYEKKTLDRLKRHNFTELLGQLSLLISALVVVLFIFVGSKISLELERSLMTVMGTMLMLFAVRHGYAYATAEKELIRQYKFMRRIFGNARRQLDEAKDASEQRQILSALGGYALDEHAEWILMHRERSIDQGEIWLMGSGS